MSEFDVSIIIYATNARESLKACLNSVYKTLTGVNFEIVIADNASQDGSLNMLLQEFPYVRVVRFETPVRQTVAYNQIIKSCESKYVFFLSPYTILINNSVKILFDFLEDPINSAVGAVGGVLFNQNDGRIKSFTYFPKLKNLILNATFLKYLIPSLHKKYANYETNFSEEPKRVDSISQADLMVRKEIFSEIGYFDEDFVSTYSEIELQFRMKQAGYDVFFVPQSKIYFLNEAKIKKHVLLRSLYIYYRKIRGLWGEFVARIVFLPLHIKLVFQNFSKLKT